MDRKEFLKLIAAGIGGAYLTSCKPGWFDDGGDGDGDIVVPVPNGYQFFPVLSTGGTLPGATTASELSPIIMINDHNEILIHCRDSAGAFGVYEFAMDFSGSAPTVQSARKILRGGDLLPGGVTAEHFHVGSTNKNGSFAIIVNDGYGIPKVYMELNKGGLQPIVAPEDALPGLDGKFSCGFGDMDLDDSDSLILSSHFTAAGDNTPKEGLFFLNQPATGEGGNLLFSTGDLLPGAGDTVNDIGLVDVSRVGGDYIAQVSCGLPLGMTGARGSDGTMRTAVIQGNVNRPADRRLRSASPSIGLSRASLLGALQGNVIHGPRVGGDGRVAQIVLAGDGGMTLYLDDKRAIGTGDTSPAGNLVDGFSGPIIGADGLLHFCLRTEHGMELCLFDGREVHSVVAVGATIVPTDGRIVGIDFGGVRNMVDSRGRLVFLTADEYGKKTIMVGIPI